MASISLRASPRRMFAALRIPLLALSLAGTAGAQSVTISGKVASEAGTPVAGANVRIPNLNIGAVVGANGSYSFVVPAANAKGTVLVQSRFIGYTPQTKTVTLAGAPVTVDFTLKIDPFKLNDVVVTGVASETAVNKVPFSVGRLSEEQIREVPASSPVASLAGKVSGVKVALGRGNPGAAPTLRLRGSTNLGVGSSSPLILIDGVITKFSISDIDASDIESIEVLKGAAAASFYGSDAANGVLNITTKRGKNGPENQVQVSVRSEMGTSSLEHFVALNQHHQYLLNADGSIAVGANGTRTVKPDGIADNAYPSTGPDRWRNQLATWMNTGSFYSNNVQAGLRRGGTNFAASFTSDHDQGILPLTNGFYRQTVRLNVDQAINPKIDIGASVTYGVNWSDYDPNGSDAWFALLQAPGDIDLKRPSAAATVDFYPLLPDAKAKNARGNPLYNLTVEDLLIKRERLLGSFSLRYRPTSWLRFSGSYGTDRSNRNTSDYYFRGYLDSQGNPLQGSLRLTSATDVAENTNLSATATKLFFDKLLSTTRLTYLVEQYNTSTFNAGGSTLVVTDVPDLNAIPSSSLTAGSAQTKQNTVNYMVSQGFDFKDRYVLDVLYRRDGSSLFGPQSRWADFYRVAGTYRLTEDFKLPGFNELRLRAARGTAGLRPAFANQYEAYSLSGGVISKVQLGNKALKPAIQTETEFGLNAAMFDRFDFELVNADRKTVGAFLEVPLSLAQSGGFQRQVQNAATVGANTWEWSLQAHMYDSPKVTWTVGITGDHTSQKILSMNRAPFRVSADNAQGQDVFYYKAGENLGIIYGTRWVRDLNQLLDNPVNKANSAFATSDYVKNSDGYIVAKSKLGTSTEAPIAYVDAAGTNQFKIGDVNPDFSFGFSNTLRVRNFSVYVLFDGQQGGQIYNFTKQWMFQDERAGVMDQSARPLADRRPLAFYSSGFYNGLNASDYFVESGSYVKLRELSISYRLTDRLLSMSGLNRFAKGAKFALIGRNLLTWTNYTGFDPEVTSGNDFNFKIDGFKYPNFRKITGQIELTF